MTPFLFLTLHIQTIRQSNLFYLQLFLQCNRSSSSLIWCKLPSSQTQNMLDAGHLVSLLLSAPALTVWAQHCSKMILLNKNHIPPLLKTLRQLPTSLGVKAKIPVDGLQGTTASVSLLSPPFSDLTGCCSHQLPPSRHTSLLLLCQQAYGASGLSPLLSAWNTVPSNSFRAKCLITFKSSLTSCLPSGTF